MHFDKRTISYPVYEYIVPSLTRTQNEDKHTSTLFILVATIFLKE